MLNKLFLSIAIGYSVIAFSKEPPVAETIDFANMAPSHIPGYKSLDLEKIAKIYNPFNNAVELCPYFNYLKTKYKLNIAVETGTWQGATTAFLGYLFKEVHSAEINFGYFSFAIVNLKSYQNIKVHFGDSPTVLEQILPNLKNERILFYLDAHWYSDWPLLKELEMISKTHRDNCIIVIDDFKVPGRNDIPYDFYGNDECSYEYVKSKLDEVFSEYKYFYIIPKSVESRAKIVVIPKKWVG